VRLWVEDRGIGVAPEHRERVFRAFERLHGQEAYPGTGIGLAIVRKAAERMGGTAGMDPVPGNAAGSRFWIELDATTAAATAGQREEGS
jgi:signal transduction histidine kinase